MLPINSKYKHYSTGLKWDKNALLEEHGYTSTAKEINQVLI